MPAPNPPTVITEEVRDPRFWTSKYPSIKIDRLRKTITVLPFSYQTGFTKGSLSKTPEQSFAIDLKIQGSPLPAFDTIANSFTVEAWINPLKVDDSGNLQEILFAMDAGTVSYGIDFGIINRKLRIRIRKSGVLQTLESTKLISASEWQHVVATYGNNTLKLYINGVQETTTLTVTAPIDPLVNTFTRVGQSQPLNDEYAGFIDELRVWTTERTLTEINTWKDFQLIGTESGLLTYFKFNVLGVSDRFYDVVNAGRYIATTTGSNLFAVLSTEGFPYLLHASFIGARVKCSLGKKMSLRFPLLKPKDDGEFGFFVMWVDEDDEVQRRKIWTVDGVDISDYPDYNGETLEDPFYLEFWNIDGEQLTKLINNLVLDTSLAARPLTSIDRNKQKALTDATADSFLFETLSAGFFPLPMIFDTQPTFN